MRLVSVNFIRSSASFSVFFIFLKINKEIVSVIPYNKGMKPKRIDSRTVPLGAKFSPSEADKIRVSALASGMTVSTLLHGLATDGVVHPRPKIDPIAIEQWRALAPMAANLNQLARAVNEGRMPRSADVENGIIELRKKLAEVRDCLIGEERDAA
jgi:hypothetical protein